MLGRELHGWDFQNKGRSKSTGTSCITFETCVPACVILCHVTGCYGLMGLLAPRELMMMTGSCKGPIVIQVSIAKVLRAGSCSFSYNNETVFVPYCKV